MSMLWTKSWTSSTVQVVGSLQEEQFPLFSPESELVEEVDGVKICEVDGESSEEDVFSSWQDESHVTVEAKLSTAKDKCATSVVVALFLSIKPTCGENAVDETFDILLDEVEDNFELLYISDNSLDSLFLKLSFDIFLIELSLDEKRSPKTPSSFFSKYNGEKVPTSKGVDGSDLIFSPSTSISSRLQSIFCRFWIGSADDKSSGVTPVEATRLAFLR